MNKNFEEQEQAEKKWEKEKLPLTQEQIDKQVDKEKKFINDLKSMADEQA